MRFKRNPFEKSTAEEELEYLENVYIKPRYYDSLVDELSKGNSRIVFGERGIGKTALMYNLFDELENKNSFTIFIDSFDDIPIKLNDTELLVVTISRIVKELSLTLLATPIKVKKLSKTEKEKLGFFVHMFFKSMSKSEYESAYCKVKGVETKNIVKNIYNKFLVGLLNRTLSGVVSILSDTVNKSLGLPNVQSTEIYKAYFPELKIDKVKEVELKNYKYSELKLILDDLTGIIQKLGWNNIVILFDKIDEFKKLNGDVTKIVAFIKDILLDTNLVYYKDVSFAFFLWSRIRIELNQENVRYDKYRPKNIDWTLEDLKTILNKRLQYFSIDETKYSFDDLFENQSDGDKVLRCANRTPRDLITLLGKIYDEQSHTKIEVKYFSSKSVRDGIDKFLIDYDFNSIYPKQKGVQITGISLIEKIKRLGKTEFTISDLAASTKQGVQTARSHIGLMLKYGIVIEIPNPTDGRSNIYQVKDPVVKSIIEKTG